MYNFGLLVRQPVRYLSENYLDYYKIHMCFQMSQNMFLIKNDENKDRQRAFKNQNTKMF